MCLRHIGNRNSCNKCNRHEVSIYSYFVAKTMRQRCHHRIRTKYHNCTRHHEQISKVMHNYFTNKLSIEIIMKSDGQISSFGKLGCVNLDIILQVKLGFDLHTTNKFAFDQKTITKRSDENPITLLEDIRGPKIFV